jgi:hypothetical protein
MSVMSVTEPRICQKPSAEVVPESATMEETFTTVSATDEQEWTSIADVH